MAAEAKDQAQQTASSAMEKGRDVAETAAEKGREVAETARDQAMELGQEAAAQARNAVEDARRHLQGQAQIQAEQIAQGLRSLEGQLRALVAGNVQEAGALPDYARQAAGQLSRMAERAETGGVDAVVRDLQRFGRNRPGMFLAAAAAAGFAVSRLWRSGAVKQAATGNGGAAGELAASSDMGRSPAASTPSSPAATTATAPAPSPPPTGVASPTTASSPASRPMPTPQG